jgi:hypothetical protein
VFSLKDDLLRVNFFTLVYMYFFLVCKHFNNPIKTTHTLYFTLKILLYVTNFTGSSWNMFQQTSFVVCFYPLKLTVWLNWLSKQFEIYFPTRITGRSCRLFICSLSSKIKPCKWFATQRFELVFSTLLTHNTHTPCWKICFWNANFPFCVDVQCYFFVCEFSFEFFTLKISL